MLFSLAECIIVYDEHVTRSHKFSFAYVITIIPLIYFIVYTCLKTDMSDSTYNAG